MSYSHAADGKLAPALQLALHRFARPWYRVRALRVFRDDASLPATAALWESIERALSTSRYFVLLASPRAAASHWVEREIRWWLEHRSPATLLLVLTEGELVWDAAAGDFDRSLSTAVPPALHGVFPEEPRHVDLGWARVAEDVSLHNPLFRERVADLAAAVHERARDALIGEDVRQHRRALWLARSAVAVLTALLMVAGLAAYIAADQRDQARTERAAAQEQARLATSRQLAAESTVNLRTAPERALLLGVQATHVSPTAEARSALLAAVQNRTAATRTLVADNPTGQNAVTALAWHPDGSVLVSGLNNSGVLVWDPRSGKRLATFDLQVGGDATAVAVSPDKKSVAVAFHNGMLFRLDVAGGTAISRRTFGTVVSAFSPDGTRAARIAGREIEIWDVWRDRPAGRALPAGRGDITGVAFSADNRTLALARPGEVELWDVVRRVRLRTLSAPWGVEPRSVTFDRAGDRLATLLADGGIQAWDVRRGEPISIPLPSARPADQVAFRPDGREVAAIDPLTVTVWDPVARTSSDVMSSNNGSIQTLAYAPDGRSLAIGTFSAATVIVDLREPPRLGQTVARGDGFGDAAFSPDGTLLATPANKGQVLLWDARRREAAGLLVSGGEGGLDDVAFSPDGRMLAATGVEGRAVLWDLGTRRLKGEPLSAGGDSGVSAVAFTADSRTLITGYGDGRVQAWDATTGKPLGDPVATPAPPASFCELCAVSAVAVSPDGRTLATAGVDARITLWEQNPLRVQKQLTGHTGPITGLAFDAASKLVASGSEDHTVALWEVASATRVGAPLTLPGSQVAAIALSPDGSTVAAQGYNSAVVLWDVRRRTPLGIPLQQSGTGALTFTSDGATLVSAACCFGISDALVFWDLSPASWTALACERAGRNLSQEEWDAFVGEAWPYRRTCAALPAGAGAPASAPAGWL
ncbi:TIR domain-containing protein [Actinoplanes sp. Pm04-4]|uniref:TIR domain-containing protein n=1 Tax=Paractinoplanes pyxinae TaxID=2997416 RepID=A0ABT4AVM2_9ACTN|nr:TIR domain-containing protein [Actinoplanes pyxinae]MCY1138278.1 TIR domain-containing protein [Actinoplanes pyxinae]